MIEIGPDWRVRAEGAVEVPLPASVVWGQMRDVRRFLTRDPLHASVEVIGNGPAGVRGTGSAVRCGDRLIIRHRFLGIGPDRVGRVLRWREGRGFAVSDLSKRGVRVGFPHVCSYDVEAIGAAGAGRCRVVIGARGRWTATWMPRWAARVWLWWVVKSTEMCVGRELRAYARWRRRAAGSPPPGR